MRPLALALLAAFLPAAASAAPFLWSVSPRDAVLRKLDAATGITVEAAVTLTVPGETQVLGAQGLAVHPQTGVLYALVRVPSTPYRLLVTVDPASGVATRVGATGNTGDRFTSLAFAPDGTLYSVTGDGSLVYPPETLCRLSTANAAPTCFLALGNGSDGEVVGYRSEDGRLYHASGVGTPNTPTGEIFERIDPATGTIAPITLSGFDYQELSALLAYGGAFFASDVGGTQVDMPHLLSLTATGSVSLIGEMDHVSRGLVLVAANAPSLSVGGGLFLASLLAAIPWWVRRALGAHARSSAACDGGRR